ncbi:ATP-dependent helicase [Paenibacillus sambharensis]|uniref:ATP-dependent helicase n=1 Tax=Paenibacillus sambharensis TaxID=1803190 RepID=A0A2W1LJC8_9BACL|nr:DEAD/DEAH box helicase [Paenibacillus sambharensis]PZD95112.1 ATP-dependent helicase [Paenibacillus sambharensis]
MVTSWEQLELRSELIGQLKDFEITEPTTVQQEAIPAIASGRDLYARSQTGTGKTLAYLLPLLNRMDAAVPDIQAVVLAPTQELAMQIVRVAERYAEACGLRVQQLIGGAALKRQVEKLKLKPHLIVGTPGRINELVGQRKLKLHNARTIVIDEADQMFELGSTKEVETVISALGPDRQIAFFSATLPEEMERLAGRWMKEPVRIDVQPEHRVAETISHYYIFSEGRDKFETAKKLLHAFAPSSALLFMNDTDQIANWEAKLSFEGFTVESLYGDADKLKRSQTLERFRSGRCQLLLATDVAARGIDIEHLPLVLNIDAPQDPDRYVHRAGRTGRMGREGTVFTIVTFRDSYLAEKLSKRLGIEIKERVLFGGKILAREELKRGTRNSSSPRSAGTGRTPATRGDKDVRSGKGRSGDAGKGASSGLTGAPSSPAGRKELPPGHGREAVRKLSPAKAKAEKEKERKNKGAPKWLKAKRENGSEDQQK